MMCIDLLSQSLRLLSTIMSADTYSEAWNVTKNL